MVGLGEDILEQLADSVSEGIYFLDAEGRITYWNKSAERITGYARAEVLGRMCSDDILRHTDAAGKELCIYGCIAKAAMGYGEVREGEVYFHHKDGHRVPIYVRALPLPGPDSVAEGAIEVFADRSDRSDLLVELEKLRREALADPLTGLGNRRFAELSLESALEAPRAGDRGLSLLLLDIDHFKAVNDNFGHTIGDRVLRMVAWTIANAVRRNDAAARWGGEEFVVLCPGASGQVLAEVAERIRALVERSWIGLEDGRKASVTVSIGGALARPGELSEALVARADERLYTCKAKGRNRVDTGD